MEAKSNSTAIVLLQKPPTTAADFISSGEDMTATKDCQYKLKEMFLTASNSILRYKNEIEKLKTHGAAKIKIFNVIRMNWDQLNENLQILGKMFPTLIQKQMQLQVPFKANLQSMRCLRFDEIERNFRERFNSTLEQMYYCQCNYSQQKQELENLFKECVEPSDNSTAAKASGKAAMEVLTWKKDQLLILKASLDQDIVEMSNIVNLAEQNLTLLRDSNGQKKIKIQCLVNEIRVLQQREQLLKEYSNAWERYESKHKINDISESGDGSIDLLSTQDFQTLNLNLNKQSTVLLDELSKMYRDFENMNGELVLTKILSKLFMEHEVVESAWWKSLESKRCYLWNERYRILKDVEEIRNYEKTLHISNWGQVLNKNQEADQFNSFTALLYKMQKVCDKTYSWLTCVRKLSAENSRLKENILWNTSIRKDIDRFEEFMMQQVELKLLSERNCWKREAEHLSFENNLLQKHNMDLKITIHNQMKPLKVQEAKVYLELEPEPDLQDSDICDEIKQLKLQLQAENAKCAGMNLELSVFRTSHMEERTNEEIQASTLAITEEIKQIKQKRKESLASSLQLEIDSAFLLNHRQQNYELQSKTLKDLSSQQLQNDVNNVMLSEDLNIVSNTMDELRLQTPLLIEKLDEIEKSYFVRLNEMSFLAADVERLKLTNKNLEVTKKANKGHIQDLDSSMEIQRVKTKQALEVFEKTWTKLVELVIALKDHKGTTHDRMTELDQIELMGFHMSATANNMTNLLVEPSSLSLEVQSQHCQQNKLLEDVNELKTEIKLLEQTTVILGKGALSKQLQQLKDTLKCQSCKIRNKDSLLIGCFHTFCGECIKKQYNSRQRKCPQCCTLFSQTDVKHVDLDL